MKLSDIEGRLQEMLRDSGQQPLSTDQVEKFGSYLKMLLHWNARINLTSIRDEEGILERHFLECIHCARRLPGEVHALLDYGSGGGFPGIPCAICVDGLRVVLAESQGKKAAFLREVVRNLGLGAEVFQGRVQDMEPGMFDAVSLRAVDRMQEACVEATRQLRVGGWLVLLTTSTQVKGLVSALTALAFEAPEILPGVEQRCLLLGRKVGSASGRI